jgi:hypothetical protein
MTMVSPIRELAGVLRNGGWILVFYLALAAMLVPTTILLSKQGASPGTPLQALMVVLASVACLVLRREHPRQLLGGLPSWRSGVPIGLAGGVAIWGGTAMLLWLSGDIAWQWNDAGLQTLLSGLGDCLAVAVAEELLFRGFPFQRLIDGIGAWPAQIGMACYFVLVHSAGLATAGDLQYLATANIFLASLLFGTLYLRTRSLALPLSLHFALNFMQGPLLGFGVSGHGVESLMEPRMDDAMRLWTGGDFGLEASLPGTLAIFMALITVVFWTRNSSRKGLSNSP